MRMLLVALAALLIPPQAAAQQFGTPNDLAYMGLVCEDETVSRAIGDAFAASGQQGLVRTAASAVVDGHCRLHDGVFRIREDVLAIVIASWEYERVRLVLTRFSVITPSGTVTSYAFAPDSRDLNSI